MLYLCRFSQAFDSTITITIESFAFLKISVLANSFAQSAPAFWKWLKMWCFCYSPPEKRGLPKARCDARTRDAFLSYPVKFIIEMTLPFLQESSDEGRSYGDAIIKFSRPEGLSIFLTNDASLARCSSAIWVMYVFMWRVPQGNASVLKRWLVVFSSRFG